MGDLVLVPRVATEAMLEAAADCQEADPADGYASELHYAYTAMLAARPPVDYDALAVAFNEKMYARRMSDVPYLEQVAAVFKELLP